MQAKVWMAIFSHFIEQRKEESKNRKEGERKEKQIQPGAVKLVL